jgi:glycosyltransferase involved in cell wall biosynthesis
MRLPKDLEPATLLLGDRRDVPRLMRALDVLVSASAYGEGFPNVLGEAMATGVACVATDVGDASLIVERAGRMIPPKDPQALAEAVAALIEMPRSERDLLAAQGRERIEANYSMEACMERYNDLLREAAVAPR